MALDDILQNSDPRFVVDANLDNTLTQPHSLSDNVSGRYGINENVTTVNYESNAQVAFSDSSISGKEVTSVLLNRPTRQLEMGAPFETLSNASSFGSINLFSDDGENLKFRKFKGSKATVFAGTDTLDYSLYEPYLQGKFGQYSFNDDSISINVIPDSDELSRPFPTGSFVTGPSEGKARPVIFGKVRGFSPPPATENLDGTQTGIYLFTDNGVDTTDNIQSNFPAVEWSEQNIYYPTVISFDNGFTTDDSGYLSQDSDDFSFVTTNNVADSSTAAVTCRVSVDSDEVTITSDGNLIHITRDAFENPTFDSSDFDWKIENVNRAVSNKDLSAIATTTGDVQITEVGGRWFKIQANGSGNINIEFPEKIKSAKMVVRAIRDSFQAVSNFAPVQDSTSPEFFTDPSAPTYNTVANHVLTYNNHGGTSFSFDYAATNFDFKCAIWFEEIVFANLLPVRVDVKFFDQFVLDTIGVYQPKLKFNVPDGLTTFSGWPVTSIVSPSVGETIVDYGNVELTNIGFSVNLDSKFSISVDSLKVSDGVLPYGVEASDTLIFSPPPLSAGTLGTLTTCGVSFFGIANTIEVGFGYRVTGRVRIISSDVESANFFLTGSAFPEILLAQQIWTDFDVNVGISNVPRRLQVGTWRGTLTSKANFAAVNPDQDFQIEIDNLVITPLNSEETITVYNQNQGELERLSVFRVEDANVYKNKMPPRCAAYDSNGYLAVSNRYSDVFGDFVGNNSTIDSVSALQEMSRLATGSDQITTTVTGSQCGFVVSEQAPWMDIARSIAPSFDYFIYDTLEAEGATMIERWNYDLSLREFLLESGEFDGQLIDSSVTRDGDDLREYQYNVTYQPDLKEERRSKSVKSEVGYVGDKEAKSFTTYFTEKTKAEEIASRISRDSSYNDLYSATIVGQGIGITIGQVGVVDHPNVPKLSRCEIYSISENEDGNTDIKFKVYR